MDCEGPTREVEYAEQEWRHFTMKRSSQSEMLSRSRNPPRLMPLLVL